MSLTPEQIEQIARAMWESSSLQPWDEGKSPIPGGCRITAHDRAVYRNHAQAAAAVIEQALADKQLLGAALGDLASSSGRLVVGGVADICVFDPQAVWTVTPANLRSQGRHTPFGGYELMGKVRATLVGGHLAFQA